MASPDIDRQGMDEDIGPIGRLRGRPLRGLAVVLTLGVAIYFVWAAVVDAPVPWVVYFGFAAVQFLSAGIILADYRRHI